MAVLNVRIPDHLKARLDRQCERRMVGRALLVRAALDELLTRLEDESDMLDNEIMRERQ